MCEVAKKYPQFQYLIRQFDLRRFKIALESKFISPSRHYTDPNKYDELKSAQFIALEEVFLTLVYDFDKGNDILWKNDTSIMFVFSLALLERDDYHISLRDQYGRLTHHSYSRNYIMKHDFPRINFNPTSLHKHDISYVYADNEVVFKEEIPIDYVIEVWIPIESKISKSVIEAMLKEHNLDITVRATNTYPTINKTLTYKKCNPKSIAESKKYKSPFCRSSGNMHVNLTYFDRDDSKSGIWTLGAIPLSTKKKIALNCGIPSEEVKKINTHDALDSLLNFRETYELIYLTENAEKHREQQKPVRTIDPEYREEFLDNADVEFKFEPPFYHQPISNHPSFKGVKDEDIDKKYIFSDFVNLVMQFLEDDLTYAIEHDTFDMSREDILKRLDMFMEKYTSLKGLEKMLISRVVYAYLFDTYIQTDFERFLNVFSNIGLVINDEKKVAELGKILKQKIKEHKINTDVVLTEGKEIVEYIEKNIK